MTNEIKEIREYISCPQFGDDHYGKWGALRLDQRKKIKDLLDYITNLQEENKQLRENNLSMQEEMCLRWNELDNLQQRIDKAIEYIKWNLNKNEELIEYFNYDANFNELLNILRGDE